MNAWVEPLTRLRGIAPFGFALVFHAAAMQRWLMVIPIFVGILIGLRRSVPVSTTSRHWYFSIVAGVALGLVFPASDIVTGPLPPAAAAAMTGVASMLALMAVFSNQITVVWAAAWGLVAISGKIEWSGPWRWILLAFFVSSLVAMIGNARLLKQDRRVLLPFGLFVCFLAASTLGVAALLHGVDEAFLKSVESIVSTNSSSASTGLGSSISLASSRTIAPSQRPVLELSEMCGLLRAKVLDQFDGQRWTSSAAMLKPMSDTQTADYLNQVHGDHVAKQIEMFFLGSLDHSLPSPAGITGLIGVEPRIVGGWIFRGDPDGASVSMDIDTTQGLPTELYLEGDLLDVPNELRIGLSETAEKITAGVTSNLEKARAIELFFQSDFEYSFSTDLSGEEHPLIVLVQERRPAFCVYFASAMAVMLRTQGVPCRIVTGYVPGEVNPVSRRVTVRDRDAHAWVEIWDPIAEHFVSFDPTPFTSRNQAMGHDQTPNLLSAAIAAARSSFLRWWRMVQIDPVRAFRELIVSPVFWLLVVGAFIVYVKRKRRTSRAPDGLSVSPVERKMLEVYQQYQNVLADAGVEPHAWETDDEVLSRLVESGKTELAEAATEFVQRYRSQRFGGREFDDALIKMPVFSVHRLND